MHPSGACVCAILTRSRAREGLSVRLFFLFSCTLRVREFFFSHRTLRFAPRLVNTTLRVGCTRRVHIKPFGSKNHLFSLSHLRCGDPKGNPSGWGFAPLRSSASCARTENAKNVSKGKMSIFQNVPIFSFL